jgi:hypothetical protein
MARVVQEHQSEQPHRLGFVAFDHELARQPDRLRSEIDASAVPFVEDQVQDA